MHTCWKSETINYTSYIPKEDVRLIPQKIRTNYYLQDFWSFSSKVFLIQQCRFRKSKVTSLGLSFLPHISHQQHNLLLTKDEIIEDYAENIA